MYRIMFSDLDETLLVNHHVPKVNQEAIFKAREKGLKFVPCTGRAFNMIPDILKEIGTYDKAGEYSLCFNGGLIVENKDNKVLHFKGLDFKHKEVVNITDGKRLGYVQDVCADFQTGRITSIIVPGSNKILNMFSNSNEIVIEWKDIKCIGDDVILVEI